MAQAQQYKIPDTKDYPKFDGGNYFNSWKHKVSLLLRTHKLWTIVEGTETKPIPPTTAEIARGSVALPRTGAGSVMDWEERDVLALLIINNCLDNSLTCHIQRCETSKTAWDELLRLFQSQDPITKMYIMDTISSIKMKEGEQLMKHIQKFRTLLEQLNALGAPMGDEEAILNLMRSLPTSYRIVIRSLRRQPNLTLQTLITELLQEEKIIKDLEPPTTHTSALYAGKRNYKFNKYKTKFVPNINRANTSSSSKPNFNFQNAKKGKPICFICKRDNHLTKDCRYLQRSHELGSNKKQQSNIAQQSDTKTYAKLYIAASTIVTENDQSWYIDTGATQHMCFDRDAFGNLIEWEQGHVVYLGDNTTHDIIGQGDVTIQLNNGTVKEISQVLYIPGLKKNLFSVQQLDKAGGEVKLKSGQCILRDRESQIIAECSLEGDLYNLGTTFKRTSNDGIALVTSTNNKAQLWHLRLGHINPSRMKIIQQISHGVDSFNERNLPLCEACLHGKQHREKFPKLGATRANDLLEIIHSDLCGPLQTATHSGAKYFLTFIDDKSRYTYVYLLKHKDEVFTKFKTYKNEVENQLNKKIKIIRSDNGGEYRSQEFDEFC